MFAGAQLLRQYAQLGEIRLALLFRIGRLSHFEIDGVDRIPRGFLALVAIPGDRLGKCNFIAPRLLFGLVERIDEVECITGGRRRLRLFVTMDIGRRWRLGARLFLESKRAVVQWTAIDFGIRREARSCKHQGDKGHAHTRSLQ